MSAANYLTQYTQATHGALGLTEVTTRDGQRLSPDAGLEQTTALTKRVLLGGGTLYFCGNGASSAMAGHMALDWLKAGQAKALSFNDPTVLTALANDTGYENVFSLPLSRLGSPADLLVTISSSGNSPNVLAGINEARKIGMSVVTFSGLKPDNKSRKLGDLNFYVPCHTYGIAECSHQVLLHAWLDQYLGLEEWNGKTT